MFNLNESNMDTSKALKYIQKIERLDEEFSKFLRFENSRTSQFCVVKLSNLSGNWSPSNWVSRYKNINYKKMFAIQKQLAELNSHTIKLAYIDALIKGVPYGNYGDELNQDERKLVSDFINEL